MTIRDIVKDAFKCDALVYQFSEIDVQDGMLTTGSIKDVNEHKTDAEILSDAEYRLDICLDEWNQKDAQYRKDARQLKKFITKWSNT